MRLQAEHISIGNKLLVPVTLEGKKNMNSTEEKINLRIKLKDLTNFLHAPNFANPHIKSFLVFCIIFIALCSLLSNILIIHVIRINKHMRTTTNYLIMNMAFGDLLVTLVSTINNTNRIYNGMAWVHGTLGIAACKARYYAVFVAMFCSVFSLVAITFDRFMAVIRPYSYKYLSRFTKYVLPVVWLASLGVPFLLVLRKFEVVQFEVLKDNTSYCVPLKSVTEGALVTICGHGIPHVVIIILYSIIAYKLWIRRVPGEQAGAKTQNSTQKTAKKVTRMIIFVLIVFEICWAPMFALNVVPCLIPEFRKLHNPVITATVTMAMCSNGVLNAVIYFVFCGHFRRAFKDTLRVKSLSLRKSGKNQLNIQVSSSQQTRQTAAKQGGETRKTVVLTGHRELQLSNKGYTEEAQ